MIVCPLVSAFFIHFGFSTKSNSFEWFFIMGLIAALLFVVGLSSAYSLGMGRPTFIFSLDKKQSYELIAMAETIDRNLHNKFLYILKDSRGDIFSIISDEQCVMSAHPFTLPVSVRLHGLGGSGQYLLRVCDQPTAEISAETPA